MNQYIRTSLGVAVIIIMASTIGFFSWTYYQKNLADDTSIITQPPVKKSEKLMACTQEAKLCPDGVNYVGRTEANCEFSECPEIVGLADKLIIESPALGEAISSPVLVSGRARGTWFFEGSFPVEIYDGSNKLIGTAPINFTPKSEQDTWMTTEFVDFKGELKFTQPKTTEGYLLFKKDNPSGNLELDESFKLPVKFNEVLKTDSLNKAVVAAIDMATNSVWDKKILTSAMDPSQKAARGSWWARDKWGWIAWQKEDGSWNVEVDRDGFDCEGLKSIPSIYDDFFHDAIRFNGEISCYDWKK